MKKLFTIVLAAFALSAFAAEPAKAPASAPMKLAKKKDHSKDKKATPAKVPRKAKLLRSNPHYVALFTMGESDDEIDDGELAPFYRRPKLVDEPETDEVSDYVSVRLAVIRAKALQKYRETVL